MLAAHRTGISHVIIPRRNEKDLKELPKGVKVNKPMFDYQLHGLTRGDQKNVGGGRMSDGSI